MTTDKIGRHTRDFDIDVKPCKDYVFQVKYNFGSLIFLVDIDMIRL